MNPTAKQRRKVWEKSKGQCWYCGCQLPAKGWHVDHVDAVNRGCGSYTKPERHVIENMVPACGPCNRFKVTFTIEEFREELRLQVVRARKYSINFRNAEKFGLIKATGNPVVFWFETRGDTK